MLLNFKLARSEPCLAQIDLSESQPKVEFSSCPCLATEQLNIQEKVKIQKDLITCGAFNRTVSINMENPSVKPMLVLKRNVDYVIHDRLSSSNLLTKSIQVPATMENKLSNLHLEGHLCRQERNWALDMREIASRDSMLAGQIFAKKWFEFINCSDGNQSELTNQQIAKIIAKSFKKEANCHMMAPNPAFYYKVPPIEKGKFDFCEHIEKVSLIYDAFFSELKKWKGLKAYSKFLINFWVEHNKELYKLKKNEIIILKNCLVNFFEATNSFDEFEKLLESINDRCVINEHQYNVVMKTECEPEKELIEEFFIELSEPSNVETDKIGYYYKLDEKKTKQDEMVIEFKKKNLIIKIVTNCFRCCVCKKKTAAIPVKSGNSSRIQLFFNVLFNKFSSKQSKTSP